MAQLYEMQLFDNNTIGLPFTQNVVSISASSIPNNTTTLFARTDGFLYSKSTTVSAPVGSLCPIKTVTTNYTVSNIDSTVIANGTTGQTIMLPSLPQVGQIFTIKNIIASGTVTISVVGGTINIDGGTSVTNSTQFQSNRYQFDGVQYWIVD